MTLLRFHCSECGFGGYEVEHLTSEAEVHCVVCSEEEGRLIRLQRWEETTVLKRASVWPMLPEVASCPCRRSVPS